MATLLTCCGRWSGWVRAGYALYDFFIGHELNPRTGSFDWKYFCELRPGLIGWVILAIGMAAKQYELTGTVTNAMILVVTFQTWYVVDALSSEVREQKNCSCHEFDQ